jgi:hypothetical protein
MRVRIPDTTAWQMIEDQVAMISFTNERYYRLDDVGSRMWELLAELSDVDAVAERLATEFEADPTTLSDDLHELVEQLAAADLVSVEPDPTTPA